MASKSTDARNSRYVQGGDTVVYPNRLGWWERRIFDQESDDIQITDLAMQYHKRPDLLAYDIYGNALLAWLVLQYNNIVDINEEFVAGASLRLPSVERVLLVLMNKAPGGIEPTES